MFYIIKLWLIKHYNQTTWEMINCCSKNISVSVTQLRYSCSLQNVLIGPQLTIFNQINMIKLFDIKVHLQNFLSKNCLNFKHQVNNLGLINSILCQLYHHLILHANLIWNHTQLILHIFQILSCRSAEWCYPIMHDNSPILDIMPP